jgi:ketosteroid isomerase-like protein
MEIDRLLELFTEDALSWDPVSSPPMLVRDKSTTYFRVLSQIFEKMALTKDDIFVSGTEASVRWRGAAVLRSKPMELGFEGVSVFEIHADGRIQSVRSYWDKAGLMARLAGR